MEILFSEIKNKIHPYGKGRSKTIVICRPYVYYLENPKGLQKDTRINQFTFRNLLGCKAILKNCTLYTISEQSEIKSLKKSLLGVCVGPVAMTVFLMQGALGLIPGQELDSTYHS